MITWDMIFHLNAALGDAGLPFKVRYLSAGRAGYEGLGHCACAGREGEFNNFVKVWFSKKGIVVRVDTGKMLILAE